MLCNWLQFVVCCESAELYAHLRIVSCYTATLMLRRFISTQEFICIDCLFCIFRYCGIQKDFFTKKVIRTNKYSFNPRQVLLFTC